MLLSKDQFPITVQAFEMKDNKEYFIAEQLVQNQAEVDSFVNRYAGKLIKAKASSNETNVSAYSRRKRSSSAGVTILIILAILIALIALGLYTGWIQRTFNISL